MIYWFIGQPATGKSTLSKLFKSTVDKFQHCILFDGDDLRVIFGNAYSKEHFTKEYRMEETRKLQRLIEYLSNQGYAVVISTVNPYREVREEFKKRCEVKEIYVHKSDKRQREKFNVVDYEEPLENFIDIDTTNKTISESFKELNEKLGFI